MVVVKNIAWRDYKGEFPIPNNDILMNL